jgi:hypothetical protein
MGKRQAVPSVPRESALHFDADTQGRSETSPVYIHFALRKHIGSVWIAPPGPCFRRPIAPRDRGILEGEMFERRNYY